ncbi:F-box/kelch-repeat protein, partial [Mucuna pruriens]
MKQWVVVALRRNLVMLVCDDLVIEILSWLPVKSLVRFMRASKSLNTFISDPSFVKLHRERSPDNGKLLIEYFTHFSTLFVSCPIPSILDNNIPSTIDKEQRQRLYFRSDYEIVGSCNGLVCLVFRQNFFWWVSYRASLWNPATRKIFGSHCWSMLLANFQSPMFGFGYDNLSDTYKVAAVLPLPSCGDSSSLESLVLRARAGESCWRCIQNFPANSTIFDFDGVYLRNNTLNWLGSTLGNSNPLFDITFDKLAIISLDLGNEKYSQLLLPRALYGLRIADFCFPNRPYDKPITIGVLKDYLSLFLQNRMTHNFSLWQMKEFGDQKSWTQLVNIGVPDLHLSDIWARVNLVPFCMFEDGHVVMIRNQHQYHWHAVFYRGRLTATERPKAAIGGGRRPIGGKEGEGRRSGKRGERRESKVKEGWDGEKVVMVGRRERRRGGMKRVRKGKEVEQVAATIEERKE